MNSLAETDLTITPVVPITIYTAEEEQRGVDLDNAIAAALAGKDDGECEQTYRNCKIYFAAPPRFIAGLEWSWSHEDFDGAEDSNDSRHGRANTARECREQIDEMYADAEERT